MRTDKKVLLTLDISIEELSESIQAACKIKRFGLASARGGQTNQSKLEAELGDVVGCIQLLHEVGVVDLHRISELADKKVKKIKDIHYKIYGDTNEQN